VGFPSSAVAAPRLISAASPSWAFAPLRSMTEPSASDFRPTPSTGFHSLQRLRYREATCTGDTAPGYAASSGFSTLLTLCSSRNLSTIFQAVTLLGFAPLRSMTDPTASTLRPTPSPGFHSLQRLRQREATGTGLTGPGYAASSGFSTLLTPCSSRNLSTVFQAVTLLGFALRRFPLPRPGPASRRALPA